MSRVLALLRLARIPNLPTAPADVIAGFLLAALAPHRVKSNAALEASPPWAILVVLIAASASIYTAGMILNDVFDIEVDRRERPGRPLPAGEISRAAAAACGALLVLIGIAAAVFAGVQSGIVALVLAAMVLAYDGFVKNTAFGPMAIGSCRFLNVLLGASIAASMIDFRYILCAASVGVFVTGVSILAKKEVHGIERGRVVVGLCLTLLSAALAAVAWCHATRSQMAFWIPFGCFVVMSSAAYSSLMPRDTSVKIGTVIRIQLRLLIVLDAAIAGAAAGWWWAGAVLLLLIPALILDRSFAST